MPEILLKKITSLFGVFNKEGRFNPEGLAEFLSRIKKFFLRKIGLDPATPSVTPPIMPMALNEKLAILTRLVDDDKHPNINTLWWLVKDIELIKMNIKNSGYDIAQKLAAALPVRTGLIAKPVNLKSKPSTQEDLESDWVAYWLAELKIPLLYHRKLWEFAYVLQALWENGKIAPGLRGIGFGCGQEPIPSYLASQHMAVTVTDLPPENKMHQSWHETRQHAASLDHIYKDDLLGKDQFEKLVKLDYVDMNTIPDTFRDYDFCWSICALEHVGSIAQGLDFIENSLKVLKSGGVAVHTTEFNYANDMETVDNWQTVLFQKKHFTEIAERLRAKGHDVAALDFSIGDKILDGFIDLPPFEDKFLNLPKFHVGQNGHIKLGIDGFACTCFGLIIRKK